ncbi:MAG: extracellular solute-binding protein [Proteobacteria bacterium]|nr:extracellular solute-binding protein [Pseudomonadota bacterium]MBU1709288.1 extracellular solute-binding protein [Pseudomonadota bacterium]
MRLSCGLFSTTLALLSVFFFSNPAIAAHGISIDGNLKYPADFKKFDYASESAKKGGHLVLHGLGSFDKMNPFTVKGTEPDGINELVFETLAIPSLDEPFAEYGLVAKDIAVAEDKRSVTFTIDERARFSDGTPITPEDIKFSLETLKSDKALPNYQLYFQDITRAEIIKPDKITFYFSQKNRELHMIAAQLPVLSKKFYTAHPFGAPSLIPPLASGPYIVSDFKPDKHITYTRNENYWAKDHPVRKGIFNFDKITYKYFKDQLVSLEAFKAHEFDFMYINIAKQWARDLDGEKYDKKILVKELLQHKNNQGMQGFVFNTRKTIFTDRKVRNAIGLAFDFEWTNTSLFFDQYTASNSYFSNSELAASGLPGKKELELLKPFKDKLPPEVFTTPLTPVSTAPPQSLRANLREAKNLLALAGWTIQDGQLKNQSGEPFQFEILLYSPSFARVMEPFTNNLKKLGIDANYRQIDIALYIQRMQKHDFDMMVYTYGQSQSPGNEQRNFWHSVSLDMEGSLNLAGINDPAIDYLVDKLIYAETREELETACKGLDRLLWYGYYLVPNWYIANHRITYRNIFNRPEQLPLYYSPFQALMTWWMK